MKPLYHSLTRPELEHFSTLDGKKNLFYLSFIGTHSAVKNPVLLHMSIQIFTSQLTTTVWKLSLQFIWNKNHQEEFERKKINIMGRHYKKMQILST